MKKLYLIFFNTITSNRKINLPFFCEQMASLLKTGNDLSIVLENLSSILGHKISKVLISSIKRGKSLAGAMQKFPKVFPEDLINLIQVAEGTGFLDEVLIKYSLHCKKNYNVKRKIIRALFYPAVTLGLSMILFVFCLLFIAPNFSNIFYSLEIPIPKITKFFIFIPNIINDSQFKIIALIVILLLFCLHYFKQSKIRWMLAKYAFKCPFLNFYFISKAYWLSSLLLKIGIPLTQAMELVKPTIMNIFFRYKWNQLISHCRRGRQLSEALKLCSFHNESYSLLKVMEKDGQLSLGLDRVSQHYQAQAENKLETISTLLGPLSILIVGIFVSLIIFAFFSPLLELSKGLL